MMTGPAAGKAPLRIVMLCDWLPPDFGAVGQYAVGFARELAQEGHHVTLVGFSSAGSSCSPEAIAGPGTLDVRRLHRKGYDRARLLMRAIWTLTANVSLLWGARAELRRCDEIRFTGSPPYLLHFVMPLACLLRVRTRYRITDFHPECLVAALGHSNAWLRAVGALTDFWRRRVSIIEVLGEDQARRLVGSGVEPGRIVLRRDPSPIQIDPSTPPAVPPAAARGRKVILYSGNWGVAHDHETFVAGYRRLCHACPEAAFLWLNATGKRAGVVAGALSSLGLPFAHTPPVPLEDLPGVLCSADTHLITLEDSFVGYVMPSKVYACIQSGRPILFIGSEGSDVHALCWEHMPGDMYRRVDVGDAQGVEHALAHLLGCAHVPGPASAAAASARTTA